MPIAIVSRSTKKVLSKLPLRLVLSLQFVVQTVGLVTLVGYLSYRSGQQAVGEIARQLMREKGDRIVQNLEYYLKAPKNLVRENQAAIQLRILDWQNTSLMQTYFTQQLKIHTDVSGLMISTQRKDFLAVGHPEPNRLVIRERNLETGALENYAADLQGNHLYLQDNLPNYDPHADPPANPWYRAAKKSQEGFWQLVVSLVRGKDDPLLMMAYFLPFADSQGEFQGVLSSSIYLDRFGEFLRSLQIGKTGQAFIIDEKGLLIATSTTEAPFRWERSIKPKETLPPEVLRLAAQDSQNPVTRTAAGWSLNQRNSLNNDSHLRGFRLQNQQYFGRVIPFQLDDHIRWTIVVVVPESDFMPEIQVNVYRTVMLCGLTLLGAIGSGIWTSKRITRSLSRLTQATQTVAAGNLDTLLPATRIAEVENLTASFRQMMIELQQANQLRQNYAQELERQVAEKTALLNEALNVAKIGTWSWNLVSDERWWSPQMYQIVGLNPNEYSTPPDVEIITQNIHPEDRERVNQITRDAIEQGISYEIEFRFLRPDGNIRYTFSRGLVERDSEGQVTRFWGISQDISDAYRQATQRKLAEIALRESEHKFSSIFHTSPDPVWIATLAEGRVLNTNDRMATFLGYSQAEMLGKTCVDLNLWANPEDLAYFRQQLTQNGNIQDFEVIFRLKSGELRTVLLSAIVSHLDRQDCVIGLLKDISDRKLAEIALQDSETRLRFALDVSGAIAWERDLQTDEIFFSSSTTHLVPEKISYETAMTLVHPDDREKLSRANQEAIAQRSAFQIEYRVAAPGQTPEWQWFQVSARVVTDATGTPTRLIGMSVDITDRKVAEQALIESEDRFQAFMNNSPFLAWISDGDGKLLYCNRSLELWSQRAASELIGETIEALHPPNISQQHLENIRYVINTRQVLETNESAFCSDGTLHEFLSYKFPLIDANGQCLVGGMAADITDLEKSEERLQLVLDASELGLWDWNIATGQTYFDPSWKKMLGYEVDEIENSYQSWVKLVHPEDFSRISEALIGYLEGRLPIYEVELRMLTKSGNWKWILGHGKVSERDASGKPVRMIGTQKDIHARKLAEAALRESKEQLQLALEGSGDGFWDWNIQMGEVYYSPRYLEMLGYEADELPQDFSTWDRLIHPDDKPWVMETLNAHLTNSSVPYKFDYRVLTKSGEPKWIANYGKVVARDENGAPLRMTGTHRDVSDKKLTEIKLQQAVLSAEAANRAKSQFLANMSHELRTPLNGILGYAQILQRDKNATPKQKEGVDIIYQCGTHLLTLINDILDLSKIEAGKLELYPEDIHFSSFLAGVSEIFQLKAAQKDINFTYLPLTQLPTGIHSDKKRLRQVLMNLLSNAVKFTATGSVTFKVEVIAHKSSVIGNREQEQLPITHYPLPITKIRFQVEDTGIGMSREELEKIFLSFEQVGDSLRRTEGTGLGLAISQKIVERMGSQIFVESTPGVGSRFWFDLDVPEAVTSTQSMRVKSTDNIIGYSGPKRKILIVDDRWENCAVIINMLEPLGFELFEAANGQEGLEKAVEFQPDLILVDLVMPLMDGHQMTRQLRQLPAFQDTFIIAISANAFEVDRQWSQESGCNDFLPKPVQAEELLNKIKTYLNLAWSYDEAGYRTPKSANSSQMVIPPPEELVALYEAACSGDIEGVEREGIRLQELSSEYMSFVIRILELAQAFEYEEMASLVDRYSSKDSE